MNAFRKSERSLPPTGGSSYDVHVMKTVPMEVEPGRVVHHVEMDVVSVPERSDSLGLPMDKDFKLDAMLKAGLNPKQVNISGMLKDEHFDGDGFVESQFNKLRELEPDKPLDTPAPVDGEPVVNE